MEQMILGTLASQGSSLKMPALKIPTTRDGLNWTLNNLNESAAKAGEFQENCRPKEAFKKLY